MNKTLQINSKAITLENLDQKAGSVRFDYHGKHYHFRTSHTGVLEEEMAEGVWQAAIGGVWQSGKNIRTVQVGTLEARISDTPNVAFTHSQTSALSPVAPMPGLVRQVLVKKGDKVKTGQTLVVIEAMKLQMNITAGGAGVVSNILVKAGQMVAEGTELVVVKV